MSDRLSDDELDAAIEQPHQADYESIGGCVCGELYPCTTLELVSELRALRERVATLEAGIREHQRVVMSTYTEYGKRLYEEGALDPDENDRLWSLLDGEDGRG